MKYTHTDNIITYLYAYTSKSFREFYYDFYENKQHSNNYLITEDYIIFDNIKPSLTPDILEKQYLTLQEFYKQSKKKKRLDNLICLYAYKYKTITKITRTKEDKIINIYNPYKELARIISYPTDKDFTHLLTVSYSHSLSKNIFEIMQDNEIYRKRVNKGIHRLRNYVYKKLKDELKKKIKDKALLNEKVKELKRKVFKYFKVYELHKSNHLHAHILVKLPDFITKRDFREIIRKMSEWFDTSPIGIDLKRIKKNGKNKVIGYVLKYMNKQFNSNNMFYIEKEKKEKIYLIKKDALIRNDIPRMISRSRNIKVKRFKPFFIYKEEENTEKKEIKEINRVELAISQKKYEDFKKTLEKFKTIKEKKLEFEIKQAEERTEKLEKIKDFLDGRYYSIRDIMQILDDFRNDKIIQERFYIEYQQALYKFLRLLDEIGEERQEEIEIIDF
jgi:hypothetical protein